MRKWEKNRWRQVGGAGKHYPADFENEGRTHEPKNIVVLEAGRDNEKGSFLESPEGNSPDNFLILANETDIGLLTPRTIRQYICVCFLSH